MSFGHWIPSSKRPTDQWAPRTPASQLLWELCWPFSARGTSAEVYHTQSLLEAGQHVEDRKHAFYRKQRLLEPPGGWPPTLLAWSSRESTGAGEDGTPHPRERHSLSSGPAKDGETGLDRGRDHCPSKPSSWTPSPSGKREDHQLGSLWTFINN